MSRTQLQHRQALRDQALRVLDTVADPELPVLSIRELGILRSVHAADDGTVDVVITPTYSGCPAMEQIEKDVQAALCAQGIAARVHIQLAPAWTTDWMTDSAHRKLREYGITPPQHGAADHGAADAQTMRPIALLRRAGDVAVPCPYCESTATTQLAGFGSTACKALYKCLSCGEPFDYFKPH